MSGLVTQWRLYLELVRWDKPIGSLLLLWPTLIALWIAAEGFPGWRWLGVFVVGTFLMRSAGCALNDAADAKFDPHVARTKQRPVARGALSISQARRVALVLLLAAAGLATQLPRMSWPYVVFALVLAAIYPFAKRVIAMPQAVLGLAFSAGIPMAFAVVRGEVPMLAWQLVGANWLWVMAYDTAYAMADREDDLKIGVKSSAIWLKSFDALAVVLGLILYSAWMWWIWRQMPQAVVHPVLAVVLLVVLSLWVIWHAASLRTRKPEACLAVFRASHQLGALFFLAYVLIYV